MNEFPNNTSFSFPYTMPVRGVPSACPAVLALGRRATASWPGVAHGASEKMTSGGVCPSTCKKLVAEITSEPVAGCTEPGEEGTVASVTEGAQSGSP